MRIDGLSETHRTSRGGIGLGSFEGYEGRGIAYEAAKKAKQAELDFGIH